MSSVGLWYAAGDTAVLIDTVGVRKCEVRAAKGGEESGIELHSATASTIAARWTTDDSESGVDTAFWSIGTTRGGDQLQSFLPIGRARSARSDPARTPLPHCGGLFF